MSRAYRNCRPLLSALAVLLIVNLSGCGGDAAPEPSAQAPAASGGDGAMAAQGDGAGDYGSEAGYGGGGSYGGGGGGGGDGYGGDGYNGDGMMAGAIAGGEGYGGDGYNGDGYGMNAGYAGGMAGGLGYGGGMGAGYGGGMGNYGGEGAMGGYGGYGGGQGNPQAAMMIQFVQQNCINCHGPQQAKGDVRLDRLHANFSDMNNAALWSSVMEQVSSGQMPPPRMPRRPDPTRQAALVAWIKSSLSEANFVPLEEQDYLSQAKYAFGKGKERDAVDLLFAHTIAADMEAGNEVLSQARWFALGLRPTLTTRFAVGVVLDAPDSLTDLKPIGTSQAGGGGGGNYGGGEGYGGGQRGGANAGTVRSFQQLTGAFGEALATGFENRWASGSLGSVFKDVVAAAPAAAGNGLGGLGYGGAGYAGGVGYSGGAGYAGGMGEGGGNGGEGGIGMGGAGGAAASVRQRVAPGENIAPGLAFIGTGSQTELLAKAAELGVDGMFVFDVKASQNRRNGWVNNDTRLRFMTLDGKTLAATTTLTNVDIERSKARGLDDDSLEKGMDRFFAMFDEKVRLTDMPALKPEHARSRMISLLANKEASSLAKMFEARLYFSKDLLTEDELSKIYQIIMHGNDGVALANGTFDDRKLVLTEVLTN